MWPGQSPVGQADWMLSNLEADHQTPRALGGNNSPSTLDTPHLQPLWQAQNSAAPYAETKAHPVASASANGHDMNALRLGFVPRLLASVTSRYIFVALFIYLVALPILNLYTPTANAMLIGGNYTNVTGALGACIASAVGLDIRQSQQRRHAAQRLHEWAVRTQLGISHVGHEPIPTPPAQTPPAQTPPAQTPLGDTPR